MLDIKNISYHIGQKKIIEGISTSFEPGLLHVIVGPNGSGKSTFLKIFSGELTPQTGSVYYDAKDILTYDKATLAKRRAVMSQLPELHFPLTVEEVVMMGRYPHFTFKPGAQDAGICKLVMKEMAADGLANRDYLTLSGGEKQRVQFARALAQIWEAPTEGHRYLFLDEPLSSLDIHYQHQFLQRIQLLKKEKIVIVAVLHDINIALQYADRILLMKEGKIIREGEVKQVVTPEVIREIFNIPVRIIESPFGGTSFIIYDAAADLQVDL